MFEALVKQQKRRQNSSQSRLKLRSGFIAGSKPSSSLLGDIKNHLGLENLLYPFGWFLVAPPLSGRPAWGQRQLTFPSRRHDRVVGGVHMHVDE